MHAARSLPHVSTMRSEIGSVMVSGVEWMSASAESCVDPYQDGRICFDMVPRQPTAEAVVVAKPVNEPIAVLWHYAGIVTGAGFLRGKGCAVPMVVS